MVNPKFKIGDKVKVNNSFYGCYGETVEIINLRPSHYDASKTVYIAIVNGREQGFDESDLMLVDENSYIKKQLDVGLKHDSNKPPIHMIPEEAILGMAQAFAYGAKKYDRFNYRKGIEFTRLQDSLMRHMLAFSQGQDNDDESGLPHTWHILANAAMLEFSRLYHPELDDRFDYESLKNAKKK